MSESTITEDQIREWFSAAADGELEPAEQAAFNQALAADHVLAAEFQAFEATLLSMRRLAPGGAPNLLPGVQQRLRARSRGRFYADRFAERGGSGLTQPLLLALVMLALFAVGWVGMQMFDAPIPLPTQPAAPRSP
jgi:anti-sigma factor RsiW